MPLNDVDAIRLKPSLQDNLGDEEEIAADPNRTAERDAAAQWMVDNVVAEDRWGDVHLTDLEEECQWSRQHLSNVIKHYFEPAEAEGNPAQRLQPRERPQLVAGDETTVAFVKDGQVVRVTEVPIPDHVDDPKTYLEGVLAAAETL